VSLQEFWEAYAGANARKAALIKHSEIEKFEASIGLNEINEKLNGLVLSQSFRSQTLFEKERIEESLAKAQKGKGTTDSVEAQGSIGIAKASKKL
jgi:hypothetical protein